MALSVTQKAKNAVVYQVQPLTVVLPAKTSGATSSQVLVIVQGAKNSFPFPYGGNTGTGQSAPGLDATDRLGSASAVTPAPTITDSGGNTYVQVSNGYVKNLRQSSVGGGFGTTGAYNPDQSMLYPSVFTFIGNSSGNTGATGAWPTNTITVSSFYPDETSIANVNGRSVYDGGISVEVYEIAGIATGVTTANTTFGTTGSAAANPLGFNLVTPSATGGALVVESLILMDSSSFSSGATAAGQYILTSDEGVYLGGSSYWANNITLQTGATAGSNGFLNPLSYNGAVAALVIK